ncbi:MAG: hypothetical protein OH337_04040 [Candidatus Parvarchaeota archaeon]|nr:hypothetical protein [Candidatus Haiyanarchaeum thermophilum]
MKDWTGRILKITCQKCGHAYKVELEKPRRCSNCGVEGWVCPHCGLRFKPTEWCPKCKRAVCPRCGACECMASRRFSMKAMATRIVRILLHCDNCGSQTPVEINQEIKCPKCGWDKWRCWNCGHEQAYKMLCLSCGWFICEECGACRHRRHLIGVDAK